MELTTTAVSEAVEAVAKVLLKLDWDDIGLAPVAISDRGTEIYRNPNDLSHEFYLTVRDQNNNFIDMAIKVEPL